MSRYSAFKGERFNMLKERLTQPETCRQYYHYRIFLEGATSVCIYNGTNCVYADNGKRLLFSNPVTHYQMGRDFGNAVNYVNDHCPPPKIQPIKTLRRLLSA